MTTVMNSHAVYMLIITVTARYRSPAGRNVSLCQRQYNCTFDDLISCHSFYRIINPSDSASYTSAQCTVASFFI